MNARRLIEVIRELVSLYGDQTSLAKCLKVSQGTISRWISGSEPTWDHRNLIIALGQKKGIIPLGQSIAPETVPIVGYAGAGGTLIFDEGQGPFGEAPMPPFGAAANTVAVIVRGDSMAGILDDGWLVYYEDRRDPPTDALLRKLCVVSLTDGRVLIKRLIRGREPGHYDLYSTNGPVLLDQPVEWAARVTWIQPN